MQEDLEFWKKTLVRGFVMAGVCFFSVWTSLGLELVIKPSIIAGGSYVFAEAMRYYKIQPDKKVGNCSYSFLI